MDITSTIDEELKLPPTRVLPIVGLDVGAIGSISLSALVPAEGILLNIRLNFSSLNK